ncbi:Uncharacterised protein [Mycobacteroides abscessus subsp. abscessus]|uniref:hypothetical protein n=1 Tax=Mycobacteroides abscessus TaxID=36809 RepID=UPI0009A911CC|nr:hypothetical protein [Mycobacteroides abscessus]SKM39558.1 Uncharacterised protein [Mycobacteroides abscessus subsp. abscessus]
MFHEKWVPYSLEDLPAGESIRLDDLDGFIPYLLERWPEGGKPHRVEHHLPEGALPPGRRKPAPGTDGWIVFRVPVPQPERDPRAPVIDWDSVRTERLRDQSED